MLPNDSGLTNVRPQSSTVNGEESRGTTSARQWPDKLSGRFRLLVGRCDLSNLSSVHAIHELGSVRSRFCHLMPVAIPQIKALPFQLSKERVPSSGVNT